MMRAGAVDSTRSEICPQRSCLEPRGSRDRAPCLAPGWLRSASCVTQLCANPVRWDSEIEAVPMRSATACSYTR